MLRQRNVSLWHLHFYHLRRLQWHQDDVSSEARLQEKTTLTVARSDSNYGPLNQQYELLTNQPKSTLSDRTDVIPGPRATDFSYLSSRRFSSTPPSTPSRLWRRAAARQSGPSAARPAQTACASSSAGGWRARSGHLQCVPPRRCLRCVAGVRRLRDRTNLHGVTSRRASVASIGAG
jgi:hypothetical protein